MGLLNYTTKIDPDKTAAEIARCLSMHGAQAVMTEYDTDGSQRVSALSFKITVNDQPIAFKLPCKWQPVFAIITKDKKQPPAWDKQKLARWINEWEHQSVRVAWRIVKDWVEAQMALVETNMVTTTQVFLPYVVMKDGKTLSEHVAESPQFLLDK